MFDFVTSSYIKNTEFQSYDLLKDELLQREHTMSAKGYKIEKKTRSLERN